MPFFSADFFYPIKAIHIGMRIDKKQGTTKNKKKIIKQIRE